MFQAALRDLGYIDGKTLQLEMRTPARADQLAEAAAQLVKAKMDVIVTIFTQPTQAAKQATSAIPIVFIGVGDPVGTGLVPSLNRPTGNVTGIGADAAEANAKTLDLLREVLPSIRRIVVLIDPTDPYSKSLVEQLQHVGKRHAVVIQPLAVRSHDALEGAIAGLNRSRPDAAIIQGNFPGRAVELLLKQRVPSGGTSEAFAEALISYPADTADTCRKGAEYVQRILRGTKPADLPVQVPKRNLIVNQKTARALGITVPQAVLVRADKVVE